MNENWVCTKCGSISTEPEVKLLDGTYGTQRCGSKECKRAKRIFHKEVKRDERRG